MSTNIAESIRVSSGDPASSFVINLCASTSPMALTPPNTPELKRFTFFVSRQREDGRERFRLHMGYFNSQQEAENLLEVVREVYPAAWVGPAPSNGAPRRARTSNSPIPTVVRSAPQTAAAPTTAAPQQAAVAAAVAAAPTIRVQAAAPVATAPIPAPMAAAVPAPTPVLRTSAAPVAKPVVSPPVRELAAQPALDKMSNVRAVIANLEDDLQAAPPRKAPAPALSAEKVLRVLESNRAAPTPKPNQPEPPTLGTQRTAAEQEAEVRVVTPEDTQTLADIRLDAKNNAPPCFAVQLVWSVSPIDVSKLPHLAIFDAYTLYNVEGNRQGRKWYGLRLGFFSDPSSATQVAHYVRSDYQTVAIVPVAIKERDHASGGQKAAQLPRLGVQTAPAKPELQTTIEKEGLQGFELLADDRPAPVKRDLDAPSESITPSAAVPKQSSAAPVAGPKGVGKRVMVRKPAPPVVKSAVQSKNELESTLELLGASTLSLDESREIINDSAVRRPVVRKSSGATSRFGKLLSRLGGH